MLHRLVASSEYRCDINLVVYPFRAGVDRSLIDADDHHLLALTGQPGASPHPAAVDLGYRFAAFERLSRLREWSQRVTSIRLPAPH